MSDGKVMQSLVMRSRMRRTARLSLMAMATANGSLTANNSSMPPSTCPMCDTGVPAGLQSS